MPINIHEPHLRAERENNEVGSPQEVSLKERVASPIVAGLAAAAVAAGVSTGLLLGHPGSERSSSPITDASSSIRDTFIHETLKPNTKYLQVPSRIRMSRLPTPTPLPDSNPHAR